MASFRAILEGDWSSGIEHLLANAKLWDQMLYRTDVISLLTQLVKEASLKTFLFRFGSYYSTLSLDELSAKF